jgi:hypothetical protein
MMVGSNGRARGTLLLVLLVVSDSFAPPPLERACPGDLSSSPHLYVHNNKWSIILVCLSRSSRR